MSALEQARRQLDWLRVVGALRQVEEAGDGAGFVVELPDRKLLALPVETVDAFKRGVLVGWTLARGAEVLG